MLDVTNVIICQEGNLPFPTALKFMRSDSTRSDVYLVTNTKSLFSWQADDTQIFTLIPFEDISAVVDDASRGNDLLTQPQRV